MRKHVDAALSDGITRITSRWWDVVGVASGDPKQVVG